MKLQKDNSFFVMDRAVCEQFIWIKLSCLQPHMPKKMIVLCFHFLLVVLPDSMSLLFNKTANVQLDSAVHFAC
jgi:hypothetical protein